MSFGIWFRDVHVYTHTSWVIGKSGCRFGIPESSYWKGVLLGSSLKSQLAKPPRLAWDNATLPLKMQNTRSLSWWSVLGWCNTPRLPNCCLHCTSGRTSRGRSFTGNLPAKLLETKPRRRRRRRTTTTTSTVPHTLLDGRQPLTGHCCTQMHTVTMQASLSWTQMHTVPYDKSHDGFIAGYSHACFIYTSNKKSQDHMSHTINPPGCGKKGGGHENVCISKTLRCVSQRKLARKQNIGISTRKLALWPRKRCVSGGVSNSFRPCEMKDLFSTAHMKCPLQCAEQLQWSSVTAKIIELPLQFAEQPLRCKTQSDQAH